jgi:hypothetical protein
MSVTEAQVLTLMTAASTAVLAGDYATALQKALAAQALRGAIPDGGWQNGATVEWPPASIQDFIANAKASRASTVGIQRTKIRRVEVSR